MEKIDILNLNLEELQKVLLDMGFKKFRATQIYEWLHKKLVFDFEQFTNISKNDIEILKEKFEIGSLKYIMHQTSSDKETVKFLFSISVKD